MTTSEYLKWLVEKCETDPEFERNLLVRARLYTTYEHDVMALFQELCVTPKLSYFRAGAEPYDISGGEGTWELATGDVARYTEMTSTTTTQEVKSWRIK